MKNHQMLLMMMIMVRIFCIVGALCREVEIKIKVLSTSRLSTLTHLRLHDISLFGCMVKHLLMKAQAIEDVYDLAPNPLSPKRAF